MPYNFLRTLSIDFARLLVDEDDHNVVITVGEEPNTKVFKAHSNILKTRSPYFCTALSSEWVVKENNVIQYSKPNLTPVVFQLILKYIYCGVISLDKQDVMDIIDLLIAADELILEELVGFVQDFLIESKACWLRDNLGQIIHTVFRMQTCTVLQNHLINEICQDARSFFISREFTALDQEILVALLKRDDLEMDEIDVWKCVLDWGVAQTPGLGAQASAWSADDFTTLGQTLLECVPLVRFRQISLSDFYDHVRPFKPIVTHDLYEDLVRSHYKPGTDAKLTISATQMPRICSNVLQPKHVALLSHWIDGASGQPESYLRTNHAFRLLYRATRDGFSPSAFRSKCNGQGSMLVVLKLEDTNRIVGGYNPIGWCNRGVYADTKESFLFNLGTADDEMDGVRLCRVVPEKSGSAIFDLSSYGPNFGPGDLVVYEDSRKCNCMRSEVYENEVVEPGEYQLAEFESFKIIEKS